NAGAILRGVRGPHQGADQPDARPFRPALYVPRRADRARALSAAASAPVVRRVGSGERAVGGAESRQHRVQRAARDGARRRRALSRRLARRRQKAGRYSADGDDAPHRRRGDRRRRDGDRPARLSALVRELHPAVEPAWPEAPCGRGAPAENTIMDNDFSISRRELVKGGAAAALTFAATSAAVAPSAAQGATVTGIVFEDRSGTGRRQAGDPGVAGVLVSNGREVART